MIDQSVQIIIIPAAQSQFLEENEMVADNDREFPRERYPINLEDTELPDKTHYLDDKVCKTRIASGQLHDVL